MKTRIGLSVGRPTCFFRTPGLWFVGHSELHLVGILAAMQGETRLEVLLRVFLEELDDCRINLLLNILSFGARAFLLRSILGLEELVFRFCLLLAGLALEEFVGDILGVLGKFGGLALLLYLFGSLLCVLCVFRLQFRELLHKLLLLLCPVLLLFQLLVLVVAGAGAGAGTGAGGFFSLSSHSCPWPSEVAPSPPSTAC